MMAWTRIRLACASVALGCLTPLAAADLLTVPGDSATIQGAINLAADDDQIAVAPGTYNEAINFLGKRVHVFSTDGSESTTIDGTGQNESCVTFENGENGFAILEGFTITGGTGKIEGSFVRGGGIYISDAEPTILSCRIRNNSADEGGGIYVTGSIFLMQIANCSIHDNTAASGAGIQADFSNPVLRNCTIAGNELADAGPGQGSGGAGFFADGGTARLVNTVVWGNIPDALAGTAPIITYSNIEGGVTGSTNISEDPRFENLAGGDLRLQTGSPCIDSGDSSAIAADIAFDVLGNQRGANDPFAVDTGVPVFGLVVDMGAYERQDTVTSGGCPGDVNGDDLVGFDDLLEIIARWGPCP